PRLRCPRPPRRHQRRPVRRPAAPPQPLRRVLPLQRWIGGDLRCGRRHQPAAALPRPPRPSRPPGAMTLLVVDVGTTGVRAAIVRDDASIEHVTYREVLPDSPAPGFVQFDATAM